MKKTIVTILKIGLAAAIIFFILYKKVDLSELAATIRGIRPGPLAACWGAYFAIWLLGTLRWKTLVRVQGISVHYFRLLKFFLIGLFFNNIMLGSMGGDVLKAYYLAREVSTRREAAVITVVADRIVGFFALFVIGFVGLFLNRANRNLRPAAFLFVAMFLVICAGLLVVYQRSLLKRVPLVRALLSKLPFEGNIRMLYEAFYAYRYHKRSLCAAILISAGLQLLSISLLYFVARLLGISQVPYSQFLLLVPLVLTVFAIPVTPSGWGTGEYAFCKLFSLAGVAEERALALDLVLRAILISWSVAGGILYALPGWRVPREVLRVK